MPKHQHRAQIIQDNLSTPHRPRNPKGPKAIAIQAKPSARVRTNDAPTEMGKASPRFHDPVGNAMKARKEYTPSKLDLSYRWSDQPDGDAWLHDARERDRMRQFLVMSERTRDRGFKPDEPPRPCPASIVAFEPERLGLLAKVSVTISEGQGPAFRFPMYAHHTRYEPRPVPFSVDLPEYHAPRVIPLPEPSVTVSTKAPWNHPKPRKGLVVTVVTKKDDTVTYDAAPWNAKTRKSLFNRIPIQSRSAKKRGFRLVPRIEGMTIFGYWPESTVKKRNPLPVIPERSKPSLDPKQPRSILIRAGQVISA